MNKHTTALRYGRPCRAFHSQKIAKNVARAMLHFYRECAQQGDTSGMAFSERFLQTGIDRLERQIAVQDPNARDTDIRTACARIYASAYQQMLQKKGQKFFQFTHLEHCTDSANQNLTH